MSSSFLMDQLRSVLSAMPDPVFILTRSGRYGAVFGGTDLRYYHDGSALVGTRIGDVIVPEKARWFLEQIETTLRERKLQINEYTLSARDVQGLDEPGPSHPIWFEGRIQALPFQVEGEDAVLWVASNITARKEMEEQLRLLSETDALTGLWNRRKLMQALEAQHRVCGRYATPAALLVFDIDHFKRINDEHGHLAGDQTLSAVADVCRTELRATDMAARLGGDEFVVLMPQTSMEQAAAIAERLRRRIAERLQTLLGGADGATVSGGLCTLRAGDARAEDALALADAALYQAKRNGRNCVVQHGST